MRDFPEIFPALFRGKYYSGTSIGPGWRPIVAAALQQIHDSLTPDELTAFPGVCQIKEKLGGLCIYIHGGPIPVTIQSPQGILTVEFHSPTDNDSVEYELDELNTTPDAKAQIRAILERTRVLQDSGRTKARPIIAHAEQLADQTCEQCTPEPGQPGRGGRLYTGSYWCVQCDEHAVESNRLFPPVYGQFIRRPEHNRSRGLYLRDRRITSYLTPEASEIVPAHELPTYLNDRLQTVIPMDVDGTASYPVAVVEEAVAALRGDRPELFELPSGVKTWATRGKKEQ